MRLSLIYADIHIDIVRVRRCLARTATAFVAGRVECHAAAVNGDVTPRRDAERRLRRRSDFADGGDGGAVWQIVHEAVLL